MTICVGPIYPVHCPPLLSPVINPKLLISSKISVCIAYCQMLFYILLCLQKWSSSLIQYFKIYSHILAASSLNIRAHFTTNIPFLSLTHFFKQQIQIRLVQIHHLDCTTLQIPFFPLQHLQYGQFKKFSKLFLIFLLPLEYDNFFHFHKAGVTDRMLSKNVLMEVLFFGFVESIFPSKKGKSLFHILFLQIIFYLFNLQGAKVKGCTWYRRKTLKKGFFCFILISFDETYISVYLSDFSLKSVFLKMKQNFNLFYHFMLFTLP